MTPLWSLKGIITAHPRLSYLRNVSKLYLHSFAVPTVEAAGDLSCANCVRAKAGIVNSASSCALLCVSEVF